MLGERECDGVDTPRNTSDLDVERAFPLNFMSYRHDRAPLHDDTPEPLATRDSTHTTVTILICAGVSLWVLLLLALSVMVWAFVASVSHTQESVMPFLVKALNHTLNILINAQTEGPTLCPDSKRG